MKVWLDDCLLHTKTEDGLLATLNFFFKKGQEHGLKLHASKYVLFATTVRYCGRLIAKDGVRFDSNNMETLQAMQQPQNGPDWVQYIAAVNWMRSAVPNYSKRVDPLQAAFKDLQEAIMESMTLSFPNPDKRICVLTDAPDRFYVGLVTQIDEEQLDLPKSKTTSL
jgi:hypothetical protein